MSETISPADAKTAVVGLAPWLPWPFSACPTWTEPVRAERLALLRIGIALCLLLDITWQLVPYALDFYGKDQLGNPRVTARRFAPSRLNWSLLRGAGADGLPYLALTAWLLSTCWIFGTSLARLLCARRPLPEQDRTGFAMMIWTAAWACYVAGLWSRLGGPGQGSNALTDRLAWVVPLVGVGMVLLLTGLELFLSRRDPAWKISWPRLGFVVLVHVALLGNGFFLSRAENRFPDDWWMRLLGPWQADDHLLLLAMGIWIAVTCLLAIGCWTRTMAVLTYLLTMSFANLNSYLDNSGDIIRNILLFYLMFCASGAAWSVDAWWKKRHAPANSPPGPVWVHPWPIRLICFQLILIYFMNGLNKVMGESWRDGTSLHYVLGDLTFARLSQTWLPLPLLLTRFMTWFVLVWELTFPLQMMWKWPRRIGLICGVFFHVGILVMMEVSVFPLYALCMYLPLVNFRGTGFPARPAQTRTA